MTELETKIENAAKVELYYKPPFECRFAVVEYFARQGKPLKIASYDIYGEELKTGKQLRCWNWMTSTPSMNFSVVEADFATEAEAQVRLQKLKGERK